MKIFLLNRPFGFRLFLVAVILALTVELSRAEDPSQPPSSQFPTPQIIELQTLIQRADDDIRQSHYEQALTSLTRAYELSKTLEDDGVSNNVLNSIAKVYFNTGQYEQAHRYYSELVTVDQANGDQEALAVSLFNLGHVNASLKNHLEAEVNFEQSLAISRDLEDQSGMAYTLKAMGVNAQAQLNF
ncbi:MAG: tetratricopeptide repeat protein, partial [Proteobacteria bacterium]|nr:tetratricopeptide repeat protein [Pseudomonadota bacterium]